MKKQKHTYRLYREKNGGRYTLVKLELYYMIANKTQGIHTGSFIVFIIQFIFLLSFLSNRRTEREKGKAKSSFYIHVS